MNGYILTGASRGLGLALAQEVTRHGGQLVAMARSESAELKELGESKSGYRFIALDLADAPQVSQIADDLFGSMAGLAWDGIYLINNAGLIEPIGAAGNLDDRLIQELVAVNVTAPLILINAMLRHFQTRTIEKRIMNISSGAGRRPMEGWSSYCASKAALDMFSATVGREQSTQTQKTRIVSVAPGVIDTAMQQTVRGTTPDRFPQLDRFVQMKEDGQLATPESTARKLWQYLHDDRFGYGELTDIRNLFT